MSDFFSDALNNADQLEQELLGPDYEYYKFVKTPAQIGMSNKAKDLITDFKGIAGYVDVLLFGGGKAQSGSQPLGDKFFLTTEEIPFFINYLALLEPVVVIFLVPVVLKE